MRSDNNGDNYPWVKTDAGRSESKRPRQKNDCTVRALSIAQQISYDDAYDILAKAGRRSGCRFKFSDWIKEQSWVKKISFPAVKGQRRMNPATFVKQYPKGVFICKVAKHVFTIQDGVVFDDFEIAPDRCIYTAWQITKIYTVKV